ncbi:hypothetical protein ACFSTD_08980 [Novosphingobium colocasiae]
MTLGGQLPALHPLVERHLYQPEGGQAGGQLHAGSGREVDLFTAAVGPIGLNALVPPVDAAIDLEFGRHRLPSQIAQ